ncbi:dipeptidase [Rhodobacter sp. CZR27]|uniref:dipeptidase n=1 Tax=Rhodobacter sp. CZR27 TaxID=2033869 RepID=UPI000BBEB6B0|nr:dipeptidase [Rhodobacter sp. CZR27]
MSEPIPVFDGHNDFLLRLLRNPANRETIWLKGDGTGHLDLPRMKAGGFAGGFFAIYIPSPQAHDAPDFEAMMNNPPFDLPLPALIRHDQAQPVALAMAGHLIWMERASQGDFRVCRSVADLRTCLARGIISGIMHMEGAEAIGPDLDALHLFHALGLRSLGPVWSRPTVFGHGVPFRFPGTPDTGEGLTEAGRRLVSECNRLKIMLDLSHLNEKGFDDVARLSDAPLVATHSNAHAVTASTRNLTDRQLDAIRESRGMVGLNFATSFLREDGRQSPEMGWEPVLRHLDHLIGKLGEDHVGLGSDFDGATIPQGIGDVTGLPALQEAMRARGYGDALMRKLCHENWFAVLERTWGA